jgi:hypothetical protein
MGRKSLICQLSGTVAILFLLSLPPLIAQSQPGASLADVARQARAQKQAETGANPGPAQHIADTLSEDQNKDAPGGFTTYDAGAYRLWLPAPYSISGQDSGGTVLSGPRVVKTTPLVLIGNTVLLHLIDGDDAFQEASTQFARGYAQSTHCAKAAIANHNAYQCTLAGANLLGHSVSGNAIFVRASSNVFPVFCVATTDSSARDILNNQHSTYLQKTYARQVLAQEDEYVREVWQKCEQVFQSIHLKENAGAPQEAAQASKGTVSRAKTGSTKASSAAENGVQSAGTPSSLANIARGLQQPHTSAPTALAPPAISQSQSSVPQGFKVHAFNYCKSQRECWDASVLVPSDAQLVSSDCQQNVFEIKIKEKSFLLLAGPGGGDRCESRSPNDASLVRWEQLVAPENARAPGTSSTISDQQMSLDGRHAMVTKIRFKRGLADWIGKRAEVESNGIPLVVGCMAPKEYFAEGEEVCSAVIESLRLP